MDKMKTLLFAAVAAISFGGVAHAGITCNMRDTVGNNLTYEFGDNTTNTSGGFGGTMVETGFEKNGTMVVSERGLRPIWIYGGNRDGGLNLYSRNAPGWVLSIVNGGATLTHNGRFAGGGTCSTPPAVTADNVGDQGL
jgi:hypothetical protein